jgi:hypothetical protein
MYFYRSENEMLLKENKIVEKICTIPVTLEDVSKSIFEGVSAKNILMHRLLFPEEDISESYYLCEGLCKPVFSEPEIIYPYVSGAFSEKFAVRPSNYRFMLPYETSDGIKNKEYKIIPPEELKFKFPRAYRRIMEFKNQFLHNYSPLNSADYSIKGTELLEHLFVPKIIAIGGYHLQATYDAVGNHVFRNGCGIVLKDSSKYPYVTAVLNSPIARLFPALCKSEMIFSDYTDPTVLGRFPIKFPDNKLTEDLINTIFDYLMFLNKQIYAASYRVTNWLRELSDFYEQISNLLILDTYFINDLDPRLLKTLEENIHPYAGEIESKDIDSLLSALYCIKQQILETSRFKEIPGEYVLT